MDWKTPPLTAAVGDVHGRHDLLHPMLDHLEMLGVEGGGIRIVLLGDYIDRGRQSRQVIERLIAGPRFSCNEFIPLSGNHDEMMVRALLEPRAANYGGWYARGGINTLQSYGLDDEDALFDGRFVDLVPPSHVAFLRFLPTYFADSTRIFVHAGLVPGLSLVDQVADDMRNVRKGFLDIEHDFGRLVVHGHSIEDTPDIQQFRLGIDTGSYRSGTLTSAVFEGESIEPRFYQAIKSGFVGPVSISEFENSRAAAFAI